MTIAILIKKVCLGMLLICPYWLMAQRVIVVADQYTKQQLRDFKVSVYSHNSQLLSTSGSANGIFVLWSSNAKKIRIEKKSYKTMERILNGHIPDTLFLKSSHYFVPFFNTTIGSLKSFDKRIEVTLKLSACYLKLSRRVKALEERINTFKIAIEQETLEYDEHEEGLKQIENEEKSLRAEAEAIEKMADPTLKIDSVQTKFVSPSRLEIKIFYNQKDIDECSASKMTVPLNVYINYKNKKDVGFYVRDSLTGSTLARYKLLLSPKPKMDTLFYFKTNPKLYTGFSAKTNYNIIILSPNLKDTLWYNKPSSSIKIKENPSTLNAQSKPKKDWSIKPKKIHSQVLPEINIDDTLHVLEIKIGSYRSSPPAPLRLFSKSDTTIDMTYSVESMYVIKLNDANLKKGQRNQIIIDSTTVKWVQNMNMVIRNHKNKPIFKGEYESGKKELRIPYINYKIK